MNPSQQHSKALHTRLVGGCLTHLVGASDELLKPHTVVVTFTYEILVDGDRL